MFSIILCGSLGLLNAQTLHMDRADAIAAGGYAENQTFKLIDQFGLENLGQMHNSVFFIGPATEISHLPDVPVPTELNLEQNFPNPFNQSTLFRYSLPEADQVQIEIYTILGQYVATLFSGQQPPGNYQVLFSGHDHSNMPLPSGVYFCRLTTSLDSRNVKFLIIR